MLETNSSSATVSTPDVPEVTQEPVVQETQENASEERREEIQPTEADAPAPTSSLAQANKTLERFGRECRNQADANYVLASLAQQYVEEFLGAAPGKAQRATAVETLADEWAKWSEESLTLDRATLLRRMRERVNLLLRCNAVASLLGDGSGVAKGDGTKSGRGKGSKAGRLPWGTLREFCPLVSRQDGEHEERWRVLPSVAEEAQALVNEVATSGMARKDVVAAVAKLMLKDAEMERDAAKRDGNADRIKAAEDGVQRWGGKVEQRTAPATQEGKPSDPPAPASQDGEAPAPAGDCRAENLLKAAAQGTAKDVAEMAVELITGGDEPDDVLELVFRALAQHGELASVSKRACQAALVVLAGKGKEKTNGKPESAPAAA
jgi:hypothetical protein